jgi:putative phage-type endonuclease
MLNAPQGGEAWLAQRAGHVTASQINNCMMAKTTAGYNNYMATLIVERLTGKPLETFKSAAMEHGSETEAQARAFYELETGFDVQEVGFIKHPLINWSGASPDGTVGDDGLVEIKCPQPAKHIKNLMGGTIDKGYALQMQWQMACTGKKWVDFVSFNPDFPDSLQMDIRYVERDDQLISEMAAAVSAFIKETEAKLQALQDRA